MGEDFWAGSVTYADHCAACGRDGEQERLIYLDPEKEDCVEQQFDAANSLKQQGYMLVDGQVSWRATSKLDVSFYINNAFDKRYLNYAATTNGLKFATLGEGREFGVKLRYDF